MPQFVNDLLAFFEPNGWFMTQINSLSGLMEGVFAQLPAIVLIVLGLVVLLFGKKILPLLKILLFFGVGYVAGFQLLTPFVCNLIQQEQTDLIAIIVGCVIGVIALLLFKILYFILVVGVFGGGAFAGAYFLIESFPDIKEALSGVQYLNFIVAGVVAVIILLIAWWLLKFIEMLITSVGGAALVNLGILGLYDYRGALEWGTVGYEQFVFAISSLVVIGVIALIGFIIQVRTRRMY